MVNLTTKLMNLLILQERLSHFFALLMLDLYIRTLLMLLRMPNCYPTITMFLCLFVVIKIICQLANSEQSHSVKTAKLLGIYLESKESRENIELAFGTIFEQLDKLTYDVFISSSPSETPAKTENSEQVTTRESPEEFTLKLRHENKTIKSLAALLPECYNEQNNVFSIECENCMNLSRKYNWTGKNVTDIFSKCYGGDLMWLSSILGLTGPNGKYFCNDCLVTLQDLKKGVPHSPVILPKYQPLTFIEGRNFEMRAMEVLARMLSHLKKQDQKIHPIS